MVWTVRAGSSSLLFVVLGAALFGATPARADAIDACVSAATSGQQLQREGKLRDARASFLGCAKRECPTEVKTVCDQLLSAVETSLPTVILGARDQAGKDLVMVRVAVDGSPVAESLDGKAIPLDPGPHALRFEQSGSSPIEQDVVIHEAEKNRLVEVTFPSPRRNAPVLAEGSSQSRVVAAVVLAGVGVAGLAAFTSLAVYGQNQYDQCSVHHCPGSTVDALSLDRAFAFGALGIGVASLGVASWLYLSRPTSAGAPSVSLGPFGVPRGSGVSAAGRF